MSSLAPEVLLRATCASAGPSVVGPAVVSAAVRAPESMFEGSKCDVEA